MRYRRQPPKLNSGPAAREKCLRGAEAHQGRSELYISAGASRPVYQHQPPERVTPTTAPSSLCPLPFFYHLDLVAASCLEREAPPFPFCVAVYTGRLFAGVYSCTLAWREQTLVGSHYSMSTHCEPNHLQQRARKPPRVQLTMLSRTGAR